MSESVSDRKFNGVIRKGTRLVQYPSASNQAERTYKVVAIFDFHGCTMYTLARWLRRKRRHVFTTEPEFVLREFWGRPEKQIQATSRSRLPK
jgi:hypothetical protein